ncbi:hypothetical protein CaCOL14_002361 [Colletotrichum acutatum]
MSIRSGMLLFTFHRPHLPWVDECGADSLQVSPSSYSSE